MSAKIVSIKTKSPVLIIPPVKLVKVKPLPAPDVSGWMKPKGTKR